MTVPVFRPALQSLAEHLRDTGQMSEDRFEKFIAKCERDERILCAVFAALMLGVYGGLYLYLTWRYT